MSVTKPLVITAGEPAGIGPELCAQVAQDLDGLDLVFVGDAKLLAARAEQLDIQVRVSTDLSDSGAMRVIDFPYPVTPVCGSPDPANAGALLDGLRFAAEGCLQGNFAGMVTAPVQKSVINDAGIAFSGHTEFLAEVTGGEKPVMLLAADELRVALATTHLPLSQVPAAITKELLAEVLDILFAELRSRFRLESPSVAVCGLNPHAGEGGHLGHEDADIIQPVVREFAERGFDIRGPLPADTVFTPAGGAADAILAMYHDQGLPVLKYAGFGNAVNITLGLPIIRTSVDHGTALDIAGSGKADSGSLRAAVELAASMR